MDYFAVVLSSSGFTLLVFVAFLGVDQLISDFVRPERQNVARLPLLVLLGPLAMLYHLHDSTVLFDQRAAAVAIAMAFGGIPAGWAASALELIIRAFEDGPTFWSGLMSIAAVCLACTAFLRFRPARLAADPRLSILLLGCIAGAAASGALLVGTPWAVGLARFQDLALPRFAVHLISTCLFGWLLVLLRERRAGQRASRILALTQAIHSHGLGGAGTEFMFKLAPDGRILDVDDGYARRSGYSREALRAMKIQDLREDGGPLVARGKLEEVKTAGVVRIETMHRTRVGGFWPVEVTAIYDASEHCILSFVRDITERRAAAEKLAQQNRALKQTLQQTIEALFAATMQRDAATAGHEVRVRDLALRIGARMGFSDIRLEGLGFAALVHDIGLLTIPAEILNRPRALLAEEIALVREHAEASYHILKNIPFPWPVADIARQHHENFDGSGYSRGLAGDAILPEARVLRVADSVEAMMSHRPFRRARSLDYVISELNAGAGTNYEPAIVDACLDLLCQEHYCFPNTPQPAMA